MTQKEAFDDLKELSVPDTFHKLSASAGGLTGEEGYGCSVLGENRDTDV
ncbi:MAG: hypothetical protein J7K81_04775 [Methanophagales archaeon]|nr:hypothetical protein [Methanophagales archaeon]